MKLRQKLAAVLAATMMVTAVPVVTMAASDNYVTKTVKATKDDKAGFKTTNINPANVAETKDKEVFVIEDNAPKLVIKFKNSPGTDYFALKIAGGEFAEVLPYDAATPAANGFKVTRNSKEELLVKVDGLAANSKGDYVVEIPMYTIAKDESVTVEIQGDSTQVSTGTKYLVATSNATDKKGIVAAEDATSLYESGKLGKITVKESAPGSFAKEKDNEKRVIKLTLENDDFSWNFATGVTVAKLGRGFAAQDLKFGSDVKLDSKDDQVLIVSIPSITGNGMGGEVVMEDLSVKAKNPELANIDVTVGGDLVEEKTVTVGKVVDFGVALEMKDKKVVDIKAGRQEKVTFKFNEVIADSLATSRNVEFKLDNAHFMHAIKDVKDKGLSAEKITLAEKSSEVNKALTLEIFLRDYVGKIKLGDDTIDKDNIKALIIDDKKVVGFEFSPVGLTDTKKVEKYTFEDIKVEVPVKNEGKVELTVSGKRSFGDDVKVEAVNIITPVKVTTEPVTVKIGVKEQVAGKVVISETDKGMLKKGEELVINLENEEGMKFTGKPTVKVTSGDLKLGEDLVIEEVDGEVKITVKRASKTASTIEITDFKIKLDRSVPEGKYKVEIGGKALTDCGVLEVKDFLTVGTPNPEDAGSLRKGTTSFVINSTKYVVNGVEKELDAAPYVSAKGRTMVPVRALADAFGIDGKDIMFSNGTIVIIAGNKTVQLTNGSDIANVNGVAIKMGEKVTIKNNRTYAPASQIGNLLGVEPNWEQATQTASFTNK